MLTVEKDGRPVEWKSVEWDERNETEKGAFGLMVDWEQFVEDPGVLMDVRAFIPWWITF